jgi:putative oxidoreductase
LLSGIFLMSGAMKIAMWPTTADHMAAEGMTYVPYFLGAATAVEIGCGLAVLLGWYARFGALALALFLVPVTVIFHDFWTYQGQAAESQMQHFAKNVTIIGGLLTLAAAGAGRFAVDAITRSGARRTVAPRHEVQLDPRTEVMVP